MTVSGACLPCFLPFFGLQKSFVLGGIAMAQFDAESPVLDWLKHNVSLWGFFFWLFFLCPPVCTRVV
jgi:hypothetical protein